MRCQYCGKMVSMKEATYDHIIPQSKGGKTSWTNVVCCCYDCNKMKGGRHYEEAGMSLIRKPVNPNDVRYSVGEIKEYLMCQPDHIDLGDLIDEVSEERIEEALDCVAGSMLVECDTETGEMMIKVQPYWTCKECGKEIMEDYTKESINKHAAVCEPETYPHEKICYSNDYPYCIKTTFLYKSPFDFKEVDHCIVYRLHSRGKEEKIVHYDWELTEEVLTMLNNAYIKGQEGEPLC